MTKEEVVWAVVRVSRDAEFGTEYIELNVHLDILVEMSDRH